MNLLNDIMQSKFILILLEERDCTSRLEEIIKSVEKTSTKICYVCMSMPHADVAANLRSKGFRLDDFFFIDVLTSHYGRPSPCGNCIFLNSPSDLSAIKDAITEAIERMKCSAILFDTISAMLIYQETHSILKFTNNLVSEKKQENVKKLFIIIKGGEVPAGDISTLTKDLEMFADKKLDLTAAGR